MRTDDQITNLRRVLISMYGPYINLLDNEAINAWADRLQDSVDSKKYYWLIKVKTKDNENLDWTNIPVETPRPHCSIKIISTKCQNLLLKYPKLISIQIINKDFPEDDIIFERTAVSRK